MRTKLCPTPPPYLEEPVATYLHIVKTEHVCNRKRTYCNRNSKPSCLISSCLLPFLMDLPCAVVWNLKRQRQVRSIGAASNSIEA
jgi:hypothetical protein